MWGSAGVESVKIKIQALAHKLSWLQISKSFFSPGDLNPNLGPSYSTSTYFCGMITALKVHDGN